MTAASLLIILGTMFLFMGIVYAMIQTRDQSVPPDELPPGSDTGTRPEDSGRPA